MIQWLPALFLIAAAAAHSTDTDALLWSARGKPTQQALELSLILRSADTFGLRPADYDADLIAASLDRLAHSAATEQDWMQLDKRLSSAAMRLVTHLHVGRVDPRAAGFELHEERPALDLPTLLHKMASSPHVKDDIGSVEPKFYHYALLKAALARYRSLAQDDSLTQLPNVGQRTLRLGDPYVGAPALRRLLTALGDLAVAPALPAELQERLDPGLIDALKKFQARHGLAPEGSLGSQTYAALSTPLAQRVRQIELTLERWRWLPPFSTPPIVVNIPQFRLFAFRTVADRVADIMQMDVIVGQTYPRMQTPIFIGEMKRVIFRPYWDVPRSITLHEMLPHIRANPNYLQRENLEIVRGESDAGGVLAPTAAAIADLAAGKVRLRQRPGNDNALGLVKFLFPNAHNVYMHSTPAHELFARPRRAFSHGCIRVSDPSALAMFVLKNAATSWDEARIAAAMQGPASTRVELKQPIRVMILYATAQATEAGPIEFFGDLYGHDRRLEGLLGLAPVHGTNTLH